MPPGCFNLIWAKQNNLFHIFQESNILTLFLHFSCLYLDEFDGKIIVTECDEKLDYVKDENVVDYTEDNAHSDVEIVENFVKYESKNICDDGSCKVREKKTRWPPRFLWTCFFDIAPWVNVLSLVIVNTYLC